MALSGLLSQMMAQSGEQPGMSESQRNLINQAGRGLGQAAGAYAQPDVTTSKGALAAALQAQNYGDMAGFKTYTDIATKLQAEEGATGRTQMQIDATAAEGSADRALRRDEGSDNRAMEKYGIDERIASSKEVAFADRASAMERLRFEVGSKEGMQSEQLTHRMKELDKELNARWKEMNEEEKGRMARAKLDSTTQLKRTEMSEAGADGREKLRLLVPSTADLEAMKIIAENHPDATVREAATSKKGDWFWQKDKKGLAGPIAINMYQAIVAGATVEKAIEAEVGGYEYNVDTGLYQKKAK